IFNSWSGKNQSTSCLLLVSGVHYFENYWRRSFFNGFRDVQLKGVTMKRLVASAAFLFSLGSFAQAAVVITDIQGAPNVVTNSAAAPGAITFDGIQPLIVPNTTPSNGNFFVGTTQFSGGGLVVNNNGGGSQGVYASPAFDSTNYMA